MATATRSIVLAAILSTLARSGDAAEVETPNLAPNPGLEMADGDRPAFWEQRTPSDEQRTLSWDDAICRSGTRSAKIESRADVISRWRTGHLRDLALEPGSKGVLRVAIKTDRVEGGAYGKLYFMSADAEIVEQPHSTGVSGTADWTEIRLPFVVPDETAYVMIYLELNGTGTAWYDDVALEGTPSKNPVRVDVPTVTCGPEDFESLDGFRPRTSGRRTVLDVEPGAADARAEVVFWGDTARYDVAVSTLSRSSPGASLRLVVNGVPVGTWRLDDPSQSTPAQDGLRDGVFRNVDLQRLSRVAFEAESSGKSCPIAEVAFTPVGRFQGELLPADRLQLPASLRVDRQPEARRRARGMLPSDVGRKLSAVSAERDAELEALESPDAWRARQRQTRARLTEFLGDFGPKCPLNARIVGALDRPDYTIEKLIFESQPGYHCTANVYLPKRRSFPLPGVLFTCGHAADGKAARLYHECCLGLVLKGYVVLALDPTGQGERAEYFDPATGEAVVPLCVAHHHYLGRPSWLVGRTLAGYRTWDCVRALDYLVTRPEVERERIAVVGNSGGGIMALLIAAVDERIRVCAAAHPGGSMEQTFLTGRRLTEADILSLIAPRPCLFIVGDESGEESGHRQKMDDMLRFYRGLGADPDRCQMELVDGVHNMEQPKRVAAYAWLNRWFDKEEEGATEPPLEPEEPETLRCTETGFTVRDLGGETGQTLNAKRAEALRPPRPAPGSRQEAEAARAEVKSAIARRLGLALGGERPAPPCAPAGEFEADAFVAHKLRIESEPGIELPALLFVPKQGPGRGPVVLHAAELGKPADLEQPSLALALARRGRVVLSVDVRGAGETDPRWRPALSSLKRYDAAQFRFDSCAVDAARFGTTMLAMRAGDLVRAVDYLKGRPDLADRPVVVVGEGLGGAWALAAGAFDPRIDAVVCSDTIPSYKLIVGSQYYECRDYYWVPGALADFDLPDLMALVAPRPTVLVDARDALLEPLPAPRCRDLCAWPTSVYESLGRTDGLRIVATDGDEEKRVREVTAVLDATREAGKKAERKRGQVRYWQDRKACITPDHSETGSGPRAIRGRPGRR